MKTCKLHEGGGACDAPRGYRVQCSAPMWGILCRRPGEQEVLVEDRCAAITLAAKSSTAPGAVIEVVHVASGEVVFSKPPASGRGQHDVHARATEPGG